MGRSAPSVKLEYAPDEHGHLQSLSSPILSKINDGFKCFKEAVAGKGENINTAFHTIEGQQVFCLVDLTCTAYT